MALLSNVSRATRLETNAVQLNMFVKKNATVLHDLLQELNSKRNGLEFERICCQLFVGNIGTDVRSHI